LQALSGAAWLGVGRLVGDALAFALFVLVAREFGPAGIGTYAFHFAIATVLYELVSLGIEDYGIREYARLAQAERGRLLASLYGAQALLAMAAAGVVLLAGAFVEPVQPALLLIVLAYQLAFAIARTLFIPAFVAGRVSAQVLAETVVRASVLAVALAAARYDEPVPLTLALIGMPVCGLALFFVAADSARRIAGSSRPRWSPEALRAVGAEIWPFAAANLASGVYTRTGMLALFLLVGGAEAGLFAGAYKFAELGWALLALVPVAAYPALARSMAEDPAAFRALSDRVLGVTLLSGGVFAWGTYWVIPPVMEHLLGRDFAAAAPLVRLLAVLVALAALNEVLERLVLAAGLQVPRLRMLCEQVGVNLALNLLLVPRLGAAGTVAAFVISQLLIVPRYLYALAPRIAVAGVLRSIVIYTLALASAAAAGALLARHASAHWVSAAVALAVFLLVAQGGGLVRSAVPAHGGLLRTAR
jgi:O-antigen/teichoic acid export membrane protein